MIPAALRRHGVPLGAYLALFALSLGLSVRFFGHALNPQTAHVLASMRAFEEWGFWTLRGASVLVPHTPELRGIDPTQFTALDGGTYLSYPSGWLVLPYLTYQLLQAVIPALPLDAPFLQVLSLVTNRLVLGFLLYLFLDALLSALAGGRLTPPQWRAAALTGTAGWLLAPPVLYWTQNAYGMDEAVLTPAMGLLVLLARYRCRLDDIPPGGRLALFVLSFLCTFIDWYGWVVVGVAGTLCLASQLLTRTISSYRRLAASAAAMPAGPAVSGALVLYQLLHYADGFQLLSAKYARRSAAPEDIGHFLKILWDWWLPYLPVPTTPAGILLLAASAGSAFALLRVAPRRGPGLTLLGILVLPPVVWTALLPQHSWEHPFSLLKFSPPLAAGVAVIVASLAAHLRERLGARDVWLTPALIALIPALAAGMIATQTYKPMPVGLGHARQLAQLLATLRADEIPLADDSLLTSTLPAQRIWYANRWIYPPAKLRRLSQRGQVNHDVLRTMRPVFLLAEGRAAPAEVRAVCDGTWEESGVTVGNRAVLTCRADGLRHLYLKPR